LDYKRFEDIRCGGELEVRGPLSLFLLKRYNQGRDGQIFLLSFNVHEGSESDIE